MENPSSYGGGALGSHEHAQVRFEDFYSDILHLIPAQGVIIDVGGGAGRDALAMHKLAGGKATVFSIDPDPKRFTDSTTLYPEKFSLAKSWNDVQQTDTRERTIFIQDKIPPLEKFNRISGGLRANFTLCSAVMMFIPETQHEDALACLRRITRADGITVLRYRTENLTSGMAKIDHEKLEIQCAMAGFFVERTPPIPDALGRNHHWHQLILHSLSV
jgi:hypothetical protein